MPETVLPLPQMPLPRPNRVVKEGLAAGTAPELNPTDRLAPLSLHFADSTGIFIRLFPRRIVHVCFSS